LKCSPFLREVLQPAIDRQTHSAAPPNATSIIRVIRGFVASLTRVHTNVIYEHTLGKDCRAVRRSREIAANCNVQHKEKRVVKHPGFARRDMRGCPLGIKLPVDVEPNCTRFPFRCEDMKAI